MELKLTLLNEIETLRDHQCYILPAAWKSAPRIHMALKRPCCKQKCKRYLTVKVVMALCVAFWSLTKGAQDALPLAYYSIFLIWLLLLYFSSTQGSYFKTH